MIISHEWMVDQIASIEIKAFIIIPILNYIGLYFVGTVRIDLTIL